MTDRVSVTMTFGGDLPRCLIQAFATIITDYDMTDLLGSAVDPNAVRDDRALELAGSEITGGSLEELEDFCVAHRLPFMRWCDAYPGGWEAERLVYHGSGDPRAYLSSGSGTPVITAPQLRTLTSYAAVKAYFASAEPPIPPFRIMPALSDRGAAATT